MKSVRIVKFAKLRDHGIWRIVSCIVDLKFENIAGRVFKISREYTEATRPLPLLTNTAAAKTRILFPPIVLWSSSKSLVILFSVVIPFQMAFAGFLSKCSLAPELSVHCTHIYSGMIQL